MNDTGYRPRLIGGTIPQAAARLTHLQQRLKRHSAGLIVPAILGKLEGDAERRAHAANGRARQHDVRGADRRGTSGAVRTDPIRCGDPAQPLRVELPRTPVFKLELQTTTDNADDPLHNLSAWGDPTLVRRSGVASGNSGPDRP